MEHWSLPVLYSGPHLDITNGSCPLDVQDCDSNGSDFCGPNIPREECVSYYIGTAPSYVAIVSSFFACLGSVLILLAFIAFKDIRGGVAQRIITALAIADFVSAAGYIGGSINYLVYFNSRDEEKCRVFQALCRTQAFVTSWSSMSSFAWTAILALYLYLVLVYQKRPFQSRNQQLVLHLFAWLAPLLIVIPFTGLEFLGFAPYAASNWCFVADEHFYRHNSANVGDLFISIAKVLAVGKLWEILTYVMVVVIYSHITYVLAKIRRHNYEAVPRPERGRVERKMIYIPVIFLLLRMWGTIQFLLNIGVQASHPISHGCIWYNFWMANVVLGYLQAIGDPGQGWGNAILYIFLSDTIRKRMFTTPLKRCCLKFGQSLMKLGLDSSDQGDAGDKPGLIQNPREGQGGQNIAEEASSDITNRRTIRRFDTLSTISCTDVASQPGPLDMARPGPSPVNDPEHAVLNTLPSETTTTTTTAAVLA